MDIKGRHVYIERPPEVVYKKDYTLMTTTTTTTTFIADGKPINSSSSSTSDSTTTTTATNLSNININDQGVSLYYQIKVDRGVTFEEAKEILQQAQTHYAEHEEELKRRHTWRKDNTRVNHLSIRQNKSHSTETHKTYFGFYRTRNEFQGHYNVLLILEKPSVFYGVIPKNVILYRPYVGKQEKDRYRIDEHYKAIGEEEAERLWEINFIDRPIDTKYIIAGSILNIWNIIQNVMKTPYGKPCALRIVRTDVDMTYHNNNNNNNSTSVSNPKNKNSVKTKIGNQPVSQGIRQTLVGIDIRSSWHMDEVCVCLEGRAYFSAVLY